MYTVQCTYSSVLPALCSLIREEEGGQSTGKDQWAKVGLYIYISAPPVLSIGSAGRSFWTLTWSLFLDSDDSFFLILTSLPIEFDDRSLLALYDFLPGRSFWTRRLLSRLWRTTRRPRERSTSFTECVFLCPLRALHNCFRSLSLLPAPSRIFRPTSDEKRPLPKQKCLKCCENRKLY